MGTGSCSRGRHLNPGSAGEETSFSGIRRGSPAKAFRSGFSSLVSQAG
jgi:hypothetical protein